MIFITAVIFFHAIVCLFCGLHGGMLNGSCSRAAIPLAPPQQYMGFRMFKQLKIAAVALGTIAMPALAQPVVVSDSGDTAWVLTASALVLLMTIPGLALFYGGLVRARNVLSVIMHCFVITCVVSLFWAVIGYSLTFSPGSPWLGGAGNVMLAGLAEDRKSVV